MPRSDRLAPARNAAAMSTSAESLSRFPHRPVRWAILLAAIVLVVYLCAQILAPFVNVIAWASVLAIAFYPVQVRLVRHTHRPSLSALLTSILVVVTILIPLLLVTALVVNEVVTLQTYLSERFKGGFSLDTLAPVRNILDWVMRRIGLDPARVGETVAQHASEIAQLAAGAAVVFATNVTGAVISFVFIIFTIFFLFRDGDRIAARIPDFLPFERARSEAVLARIRDVINASVYGVLVIAAIQGLLIGVAFSVLRIPSAALWGVVTLVTSVIPLLGAGAVWGPGAIYLALTGHWVKAILLAVWGGAIVSSVDNFLRPKLVGGKVGLSELVIFFSVLGGIQAFGILGLIVGPVLFAIAGSLLEVLSETDASGS
jgi:predicted PurR-regulated permease PerM